MSTPKLCRALALLREAQLNLEHSQPPQGGTTDKLARRIKRFIEMMSDGPVTRSQRKNKMKIEVNHSPQQAICQSHRPDQRAAGEKMLASL